jgi:hypothetical protein
MEYEELTVVALIRGLAKELLVETWTWYPAGALLEFLQFKVGLRLVTVTPFVGDSNTGTVGGFGVQNIFAAVQEL